MFALQALKASKHNITDITVLIVFPPFHAMQKITKGVYNRLYYSVDVFKTLEPQNLFTAR